MDNQEINELAEFCKIFNITQIPEGRNYWLIRTSSGTYFNDFYNNNYVAIAWDEFSDINQMKNEKEDSVKEKIAQTYKDEKRPGYIYNQIRRFMFEIKEGDMVLIPDENSTNIAFGIVTKEFYVKENNINNNSNPLICNFKKRININWIKIICKDNFEPYLRMLMFAHTTVSDVNDYRDYINRALFPIYICDNKIHLTYAVQTTDDISLMDFSGFLNTISNSISLFDNIVGTNYKSSKIDIKTTVNSPGVIEFIGICFGSGLALTCLNSFLFGGKMEVDLLKLGKFSSEHSGIFGTILKFQQEKNKQETKLKALKNQFDIQKRALKIKAPNENIKN